jgi:hypothetical protein
MPQSMSPPRLLPLPKNLPSKRRRVMPRLSLLATLAFPLALAACGSEEASPPGEVTPGEAKALDEAAQMLDERRLPPEALTTDGPTDAPAEVTGDAAPVRR